VEEAARWTREHGLTAQDEVSYLQERDHLVLARVLLAQGQADHAWDCWSAWTPWPTPSAAPGA
jgi:LuxR family maltose regulon positive regulatory protein